MKKLFLLLFVVVATMTSQSQEFELTPGRYFVNQLIDSSDGIITKQQRLPNDQNIVAIVVDLPRHFNRNTAVTKTNLLVRQFEDVVVLQSWASVNQIPNGYGTILFVDKEKVTVIYVAHMNKYVFFIE